MNSWRTLVPEPLVSTEKSTPAGAETTISGVGAARTRRGALLPREQRLTEIKITHEEDAEEEKKSAEIAPSKCERWLIVFLGGASRAELSSLRGLAQKVAALRAVSVAEAAQLSEAESKSSKLGTSDATQQEQVATVRFTLATTSIESTESMLSALCATG